MFRVQLLLVSHGELHVPAMSASTSAVTRPMRVVAASPDPPGAAGS